MRRARLQLPEDRVADGLLVPQRPRIPEAQFLDPDGGEEPGSLHVVRVPAGKPMAAAVQFNREICLPAVETQEIGSNGMPPAEFVGSEPPVAGLPRIRIG